MQDRCTFSAARGGFLEVPALKLVRGLSSGPAPQTCVPVQTRMVGLSGGGAARSTDSGQRTDASACPDLF